MADSTGSSCTACAEKDELIKQLQKMLAGVTAEGDQTRQRAMILVADAEDGKIELHVEFFPSVTDDTDSPAVRAACRMVESIG